MLVQMIAWTHFESPTPVPKDLRGVAWGAEQQYDGDSDHDGQDLIEFAGRACYESWGKPNPETRANGDYVRHIVEVGHDSVLEHPSVSFYITGVSRSLTHELVRHRLFSYSQRSQRYVDESTAEMVVPDAIVNDPHLSAMFRVATERARRSYHNFTALLEARGLNLKERRGAARAVLPSATETRIVVTGNYRAWRHFLRARTIDHAEVEIRMLARELGRQLYAHAPEVFEDIVNPPPVTPQCTVCAQGEGNDCQHFEAR